MSQLQNGERVHLVDKKGRQYALTLKAGDIYHFSGETIPHDELIGKPDGTVVTLSKGKRFLALRPTFGEYVLKMPRGAQVLYPKDLSLIPMWADVYPGARVFEAGTGSGALTMALLRAVGPTGLVVTYEARDDFARTALTNIERYMGPVSFVPTIPQVMQTVDALERTSVFGMIETFETLLRTWSIQGRSVRPDHRMVAHSGFLTVARKVEEGWWSRPSKTVEAEAAGEQDDEAHEGEDAEA